MTTRLLVGVFGFDDHRENPLLAALPRLLHLRGDETDANGPDALLVATVALLGAEIGSGRPGTGTVAGRLADVLFIQIVRKHLAMGALNDRGWLRGIADPQLGRALSAMHARPEHSWSVVTLAAAAGMSRSRFHARFRDVVGQTPLEYIARWRMYLAAGQLKGGNIGLATLAKQAGYCSDVAFSKAFKRWMGCSPAEYRRRAKTII